MVVVTVLGATWIMVRWIDRRRFVTVGFEPRHALRDLSVGVLIGACWVAASILPLLLGNVASFQDSPTWSGTLGWSGLAIFLNAVAQEVLVRGYLFQVVRSATTPSLAILVSSLLFTALHAGAFDRLGLPVLNVFLAGVLFGLACLLTGNLWLPISIHFSWNFLLGAVLGSTVSGKTLGLDQEHLHLSGPSIWTGGPFGLEGSLVVTIVTAGLCLGFLSRVRTAPRVLSIEERGAKSE